MSAVGYGMSQMRYNGNWLAEISTVERNYGPLVRANWKPTQCLGDNWIAMSSDVANELLLPPKTQVCALVGGFEECEAVDSPDSPLVVSEGTAYAQQIQSYAELYGGNDKQRMEKRCLIGELLVHISNHNDRLLSLNPESFLASIPYNKAYGDVFKSRLKNRSREAIRLPKKPSTARNLFIAEKRNELLKATTRDVDSD